MGVIGLALVAVLVLLAITANMLAPFDPLDASARANLDPDAIHPMGTDPVGKDIYSLLLHGARISLSVALAAVLLGVSGGALFGLATGYAGGAFDLLGQ